jgi:hypothetical protein
MKQVSEVYSSEIKNLQYNTRKQTKKIKLQKKNQETHHQQTNYNPSMATLYEISFLSRRFQSILSYRIALFYVKIFGFIELLILYFIKLTKIVTL